MLLQKPCHGAEDDECFIVIAEGECNNSEKFLLSRATLFSTVFISGITYIFGKLCMYSGAMFAPWEIIFVFPDHV